MVVRSAASLREAGRLRQMEIASGEAGLVDIAVVGAGPAGLMAAERLAGAGVRVTVYERLPNPARRLLMAGRGGLNLTHSEPESAFLARYGAASAFIAPLLTRFGAAELRAWADGLGAETFIGSSGRVFPRAMKASPLLRAWLARLDGLGVRIETRHRFLGRAEDGSLRFDTPQGRREIAAPDATVLALGGQTWPKLGADPAWPGMLADEGVEVAPARAVNCGLLLKWSAHLRTHFAGVPLKHVGLSVGDRASEGDAILTPAGLEGGAVYGLGPELPIALAAGAPLMLRIDLRPRMSAGEIATRLARAGSGLSLANRLRRALRLAPVAASLLREDGAGGTAPIPADPAALAGRIKALELPLRGAAGLDRAISSAGGVTLDSLDGRLMLRACPGVFVAGEMLDWTAPTGGYLLQAAFASGLAAAQGALDWLAAGLSG